MYETEGAQSEQIVPANSVARDVAGLEKMHADTISIPTTTEYHTRFFH